MRASPSPSDTTLTTVAKTTIRGVYDAPVSAGPARGGPERSQDGGASWIATPLQAGDSITGGVAPARSICWLIGPAGLVMVTADGLTFARVPLPERVDLTAVTATDALAAVVTTVDGRRFRTDDGGRTWRQN